MFKRLFARKELEKLARTDLALAHAFQFLAFAGPARAAINYVAQVMDGQLSVNAITEIRDKVRAAEKHVAAQNAAYIDKARENEDVWRAKAQALALQASQGWTRYEEANRKHNKLEIAYARLVEENRQLKSQLENK